MTRKTSQERVANTQSKAIIISAIISSIATLAVALLASAPFGVWLEEQSAKKDTNWLAIEEIPQYIFTFAGEDENFSGSADMELSYIKGISPSYIFRYNLPKDQYSYAGLAFRFNDATNITDYTAIEFKVLFEAKNDLIDLHLKDIANSNAFVRVFSTGTNEMNISYPLSNFTPVNLNALKEITFYSENNADSENHKVVIHDIRFVK